MDPIKAFELIDAIVANTKMSRQDHMTAIQASLMLKPKPVSGGFKPKSCLDQEQEARDKKKEVEDGRADDSPVD